LNRLSPSDALLDGLSIDAVLVYLEQTGWTRVDHPNDRIILLEGPLDDAGNPLQLILPRDRSLDDAKARLAETIDLLAVLRHVSPEAVVQRIIGSAETASSAKHKPSTLKTSPVVKGKLGALKKLEPLDHSSVLASEPVADHTKEAISDEVFRERIRQALGDRVQSSSLYRVSFSPLISVIAAFLLSGVIGVYLTNYYGRQQSALVAKQHLLELNGIRVQKVGEMWERIDANEPVIDKLLEGPFQDSKSNDQRIDHLNKLLQEDMVIVNQNRFWLGETFYNRIRDYLQILTEYASRKLLGGQDAEINELATKRSQLKQDIISIRSTFFEGEPYRANK